MYLNINWYLLIPKTISLEVDDASMPHKDIKSKYKITFEYYTHTVNKLSPFTYR